MSALTVPPHIKLCSALTMDFPSEISSIDFKGTLYRVAAIVVAVAVAIILFSSSMICSGLINPSGTWVILSSLLAALAAFKGPDVYERLWKNANLAFDESATLTKIVEKMSLMSHWGESEVVEYLNERHLTIPTGDMLNSLDQICPHNPFKAFLPLIAREKVLEEQAAGLKKKSRTNLKSLHKNEMASEIKKLTLHQLLNDRYELAVNTIQRAICLQNLKMPDHEFELVRTDEWQMITGESKNAELGSFYGQLQFKGFDELMQSYRPEAEGYLADDDHSRDFLLRQGEDGEDRNISLDTFVLDLDLPLLEEENYASISPRIPPICLPVIDPAHVLTVADVRTQIFG